MTLVDQILQSPLLPDLARQINDVVESERPRRQKFFDDLREDEKAEFINGEVFVHSPVRQAHSLVSDALYLLIGMFNMHRRLGEVAHETRLIHLSRNDYEPDICFWHRVKAATFTPDQMRFPAPDFIAEVLSPSTEAHDRGIKLEDYAAHAVAEYWIVDPDSRAVEQYLLRGESYLPPLKVCDGTLESEAIPGFRIPSQALFDEDVRATVLSAWASGPR